MNSPYALLIRAALRADGVAFDRIVSELERVDASAEFLGAAFHVALRRRFTIRDPTQVIRFVGEMRANSDRTGDDIDPNVAERAIQCVLDGNEPDVPFDPDKLLEIEYLVILKVLRDADVSDAELDDFFADCNVVLNDYLDQKS